MIRPPARPSSTFSGERYPAPQPQPLRRLLQIAGAPMLAFFILPLLAILLNASPAAILDHLRRPEVIQAIGLSLLTSLAAALLSVVFGTPLAFGLARGYFRSRRLVETLVDLPIVLPPAVAGIALLLIFGRRGLLGALLANLGLQIAFTPLAVILAQTFIAAPFYIKSAVIGFSAIDPELEQSAGLDGAGPLQIFRYVIVPLSWTALLSGAVMTWARALGEFGATIIFAGNFPGRTQTMPLAIYIGFELDLEIALTLALILMGLSSLALFVIRGLLQREV